MFRIKNWLMERMPYQGIRVLGVALLIGLAAMVTLRAGRAAVTLPDAAFDAPLAKTAGNETVVLAGGCFWGIQAVFERLKGVTSATAGYSGGSARTANYETVSQGTTGHAESVQIVFNPAQITFGQLLKVFFSVAHDPTELNRQGPDEGTQYRSVIFYATDEQQKIADAYIGQLNSAKVFRHRIVTQVVPLTAFYPAEAYHQDYAAHNPGNLYIMLNDAPKVRQLEKQYPELCQRK